LFWYNPWRFFKEYLYFHYHRNMLNQDLGKAFKLRFLPCLKCDLPFVSKALFILAAPLGGSVYLQKKIKNKLQTTKRVASHE